MNDGVDMSKRKKEKKITVTQTQWSSTRGFMANEKKKTNIKKITMQWVCFSFYFILLFSSDVQLILFIVRFET